MTKVVITGFMGTGKTSVGGALAARLGVAFVDTDRVVESREGCTVAEIFSERGESYFREAERRALADVLEQADAVVATGGGAILDEGNLARMREAAPIICLTARADVIAARTAAQGASRPLLSQEDRLERIEALLAERAAAYGRADWSVDTSERTVDEVVLEIENILVRRDAARKKG